MLDNKPESIDAFEDKRRHPTNNIEKKTYRSAELPKEPEKQANTSVKDALTKWAGGFGNSKVPTKKSSPRTGNQVQTDETIEHVETEVPLVNITGYRTQSSGYIKTDAFSTARTKVVTTPRPDLKILKTTSTEMKLDTTLETLRTTAEQNVLKTTSEESVPESAANQPDLITTQETALKTTQKPLQTEKTKKRPTNSRRHAEKPTNQSGVTKNYNKVFSGYIRSGVLLISNRKKKLRTVFFGNNRPKPKRLTTPLKTTADTPLPSTTPKTSFEKVVERISSVKLVSPTLPSTTLSTTEVPETEEETVATTKKVESAAPTERPSISVSQITKEQIAEG